MTRLGDFLREKITHSRFADKHPGLAKVGAGCVGGVGDLVAFEKGGHVKKTAPALVHAGEYVLPKGVKPTAAQKKAVAKGKAQARKAPVRRRPPARKPPASDHYLETLYRS